MSDAELAAFEASQNFEALLVQSAREASAGKTRAIYTPVVVTREPTGLSQTEAIKAANSNYKASRRMRGGVKAKQTKA